MALRAIHVLLALALLCSAAVALPVVRQDNPPADFVPPEEDDLSAVDDDAADSGPVETDTATSTGAASTTGATAAAVTGTTVVATTAAAGGSTTAAANATGTGTTAVPRADGTGTTATGPTVATTTAARGTTTTAVRVTTSTTDDGVCFPASARAIRADGSFVRMEDLSVGDVLRVGGGKTSPVFMFTHKDSGYVGRFVEMTAGSAKLTLTPSHFLYVNGALAAARTVAVGDIVELESGETIAVDTVREVMERGLYNPQTVHGDIVVEGVRASTYTQAVEPALAHAVLAPFRAVFGSFGWYTAAFDSGSPLAKVVPSGAAVY